MLNIFLLIIILLIIFYILNKFVFKNEIQENYLTYFLPFYDDKINDLTDFYINDDNNKNYFKKKFDYNLIKVVTNNNTDKYFIKLLLSNYMKNSITVRQIILNYDNNIDAIRDLNSNKINFYLQNIASMYYYNIILKNDINNIRLITKLYKLYLYFFTMNKYNVYSLDNIPTNFIIGIVSGKKSFVPDFFYKKILKDLGYIENIDYKFNYYDNLNNLFKDFINSKCNLIIVLDIYPNNDINNFIDNNIDNEIILLPFNVKNEDLFLKKNYFIHTEYVDLNYFATSYLPKKFDNNEYTINRPDFKICYIYQFLYTNIYNDEAHIYDYIKFIYQKYKYINSMLKEKGYKINVDPVETSIIEYHAGVIKYFYEYGYYTNTDNDNCKYLVGKLKCNNVNLKNNNF